MARNIAGVTDDAVREATGADWDHWLAVLDERDATELDHPEIVAELADAGVESGWWRQTITVGYERERGLREVGETADAGFEVGVQRTLEIPQDRLWECLLSRDGQATWLGTGADLAPDPRASYETADGTAGEVRTVAPGERLRLTWQPADRDEPTTLQLSLACPRNDRSKTVLRVHHEKLANADEREAMREHWRAVLDRIQDEVGSSA